MFRPLNYRNRLCKQPNSTDLQTSLLGGIFVTYFSRLGGRFVWGEVIFQGNELPLGTSWGFFNSLSQKSSNFSLLAPSALATILYLLFLGTRAKNQPFVSLCFRRQVHSTTGMYQIFSLAPPALAKVGFSEPLPNKKQFRSSCELVLLVTCSFDVKKRSNFSLLKLYGQNSEDEILML